MAKRIVWTAVAVYASEDDVDPIVAVGHSKEAAENALAWKIAVSTQDQPEGADLWVTYPAEEHSYDE